MCQNDVLEEPLDNSNDNINIGGEACFNLAKGEYEHTLNRSDKLDNKIYISLTFYAFMFVFVKELLDNILKFKYPSDIAQYALVTVYIVICIFTIGLFIYTLLNLVRLLKPMQIEHLNLNFLVENYMQEDSPNVVYSFAFNKYSGYAKENNKKLESRFNKYDKCLDNIFLIVILSFALNILNMFISKGR